MTLHEILKLPTTKLASLSDKQLEELLGPFIPACREPDRENLQHKEVGRLLKQGATIMAQMGINLPKPQPKPASEHSEDRDRGHQPRVVRIHRRRPDGSASGK